MTNYEKFLKKVLNIVKKLLIFCSNCFYSICFKSTKKNYQNGHFNFSFRWPHIFYMLFEKLYDIFMGFSVETIFISCSKFFKLTLLEYLSENIENGYFHYFQICSLFVSSLLFILWIILFEEKLLFGKNPSKPSFIQN